MRPLACVPAALLLLCAAVVVSQPTPSTSDSDGLALLQRVAQHYADARSYRIQSTEERTQTTDYSRDWRKSVLTAAEAPGNRHYFEGRAEMGSAINVSDGATVWKYHVDQHRYTARPVSATNDKKPELVGMSEMAEMEASNLRRNLAGLDEHFKSAQRLPDIELAINGERLLCEVIHLRTCDQNRPNPGYEFDRTIWIDKAHETVLRMVEQAHTFMLAGGARIPVSQEITTTYTSTVLDSPLPESQFTFIPPPDARQIQNFPDPREVGMGASMVGDLIPPLKLKSSDGKTIPIESFRGKPVLIDFWATWCAPCVAALPKLAEIQKQAGSKGLLLLSVDQDEEASKAADLLSSHGYAWPNFHDGDGEIQKLMGSNPIPRLVLVDAKGEIVYDSTGADENRLRTHIAELGPDFKDLAPKPIQPPPCVASK